MFDQTDFLNFNLIHYISTYFLRNNNHFEDYKQNNDNLLGIIKTNVTE